MNKHESDSRLVRERLAASGSKTRALSDLEGDKRELANQVDTLVWLLSEVRSGAVRGKIVSLLEAPFVSPKSIVAGLDRLAEKGIKRRNVADPSVTHNVSRFIAEVNRIRLESDGSYEAAWHLADVLRTRADESVFDDVVRLVRDQRLQGAREMLPYALERFHARRQEVVNILLELVDDQEVTPQVLDVLGRIGDSEMEPRIRPYLGAEDDLVRRMAKKALRRVKRTSEPDPLECSAPRGSSRRVQNETELSEASMNFDLDQVVPFFERVGTLVEGLGSQQRATLTSALRQMESDQLSTIDFDVSYLGHKTLLRVTISMSDVDSPDVAFFCCRGLAEAIDRLMEEESTRPEGGSP